jgi:hypothetical protein
LEGSIAADFVATVCEPEVDCGAASTEAEEVPWIASRNAPT